MNSKVVYVTSDAAEIFTLHAESNEAKTMRKHGPRHPSEPHGKHQLKQNDDVERFLHEVAAELEKDEARILLVGPAQAKTRLKSYIDHARPRLAQNIVGVEPMDEATGPQIVAFARKYFTKLGMYDAI